MRDYYYRVFKKVNMLMNNNNNTNTNNTNNSSKSNFFNINSIDINDNNKNRVELKSFKPDILTYVYCYGYVFLEKLKEDLDIDDYPRKFSKDTSDSINSDIIVKLKENLNKLNNITLSSRNSYQKNKSKRTTGNIVFNSKLQRRKQINKIKINKLSKKIKEYNDSDIITNDYTDISTFNSNTNTNNDSINSINSINSIYSIDSIIISDKNYSREINNISNKSATSSNKDYDYNNNSFKTNIILLNKKRNKGIASKNDAHSTNDKNKKNMYNINIETLNINSINNRSSNDNDVCINISNSSIDDIKLNVDNMSLNIIETRNCNKRPNSNNTNAKNANNKDINDDCYFNYCDYSFNNEYNYHISKMLMLSEDKNNNNNNSIMNINDYQINDNNNKYRSFDNINDIYITRFNN